MAFHFKSFVIETTAENTCLVKPIPRECYMHVLPPCMCSDMLSSDPFMGFWLCSSSHYVVLIFFLGLEGTHRNTALHLSPFTSPKYSNRKPRFKVVTHRRIRFPWHLCSLSIHHHVHTRKKCATPACQRFVFPSCQKLSGVKMQCIHFYIMQHSFPRIKFLGQCEYVTRRNTTSTNDPVLGQLYITTLNNIVSN